MMKIGRIKNAGALGRYMEGRQRTKEPEGGLGGYLTGHGDPPGRWIGTAGLAAPGAPLAAEQLGRVLAGHDPTTDKILVEGVRGNAHHPGWEMTFAAPKSVSVVWATASPEQRAAIADAQAAAVAATMDYAERHLVFVRRGHAGAEWEKPAATVSAVYDHGASRSGDPHLHSHVVLANLAKRQDGTWGTLESRKLFRHQKELGALYRAELSYRLRSMGYSIEPTAGGEFELAGVPKALRAELSSRHDQVVGNRREIAGDTKATAAQEELSWAKDRPAKGERTDYDAMYARARDAAARHGFDPATIRRETGPGRASRAARGLASRAEWWGISVGEALTEQNSTFAREDVVAALAAREPGRLTIGQIERRVDHALARDRRFVAVGRDDADPSGAMRYTTADHLAAEKRMVHDMQELAMERGREAAPSAVRAAIQAAEKSSGHPLSEEQRAAIAAATSGHRLATIRGAAGAGKTTALKPVVAAYTQAGYTVHGVALASSAADVLGRETGLPQAAAASAAQAQERARERAAGTPPAGTANGRPTHRDPGGAETIARLLKRAEHAQQPVLTERSVLIVDEAGMVDTAQMAKLVALAHDSGAKVILVGDEKQLQAVGAGGGFQAAQVFTQEHGSHAELTENYRQHDAGDKAATRALEAGEAAQALEHYAAKGQVAVGTGPELVRRMADDWWQDAQTHTDHAMMISGDNATVGELGRMAQRHLQEAGRLGDAVAAKLSTAKWGATDLYQCDQIMLRTVSSARSRKRGDGVEVVAGDRKAQIANGATGRVTGRDEWGRLQVTLDGPDGEAYGGASLAIDPAKYRNWHLSYASTTHKAQGATTDRVMAHIGAGTAREMSYVAGSRHRDSLQLYLDGTGTTAEVVRGAARTMARSQEKRLAVDIAAERQAHATRARLHALTAGGVEDAAEQQWRRARQALAAARTKKQQGKVREEAPTQEESHERGR